MTDRKLDDWLTAYMEYTKNSEPSELYRLWVAVGTLAAALQRKCTIPFLIEEGKELHTNFYIVLVGPSGEARKGTALMQAYDIIKGANITLATQATSQAALIRQMEKANVPIVSDTGVPMGEHCSLTVFSEELTVFIGYNEQALISNLCMFYDCRDDFDKETIGRGAENIKGVWLNLIGGTTPSTLQLALPAEAVGGGLMSRMILVCARNKGQRRSPLRQQREPEYMKNLKQILTNDLMCIRRYRGSFVLTPAYIDTYTDWYETGEGSQPRFDIGEFSSYNGRRASHLMKLAAIMSTSRKEANMQIDVCDFDRALGILQQTEENMPMAFEHYGMNKYAALEDDILRFIADTAGPDRRVSAKDIMRKFGRNCDKETMCNILATLEARDFITIPKTDGVKYILYNGGVK